MLRGDEGFRTLDETQRRRWKTRGPKGDRWSVDYLDGQIYGMAGGTCAAVSLDILDIASRCIEPLAITGEMGDSVHRVKQRLADCDALICIWTSTEHTGAAIVVIKVSKAGPPSTELIMSLSSTFWI